MAFTPDSDVYLCRVPFSADQKNQINFSSAGAQSAYFSGLTGHRFSDYTYQRKDNIIRVGVNSEHLWNYNYCMYQNSNFGNKWFYAFITKIEYINANCTHLHIKTDVFQTWMFDYTFQPCMVLREHVEDDTPFLHTVPDYNIEADYTGNSWNELTPDGWNFGAANYAQTIDNYYLCIVCSDCPDTMTFYPASWVTGTLTNVGYLVTNPDSGALQEFNKAGKTDAIISCFMLPRCIADSFSYQPSESSFGNWINGYNSGVDGRTNWRTFSPWKGQLDGYQPKNNKCYCYPYNYLRVSNLNGQDSIYKYEEFQDTNLIEFKSFINMMSGCEIACCPVGYGATGIQYQEKTSCAGFPESPFTVNSFQNYIALNKNSLMFNTVTTGISGAVSAASGNPGGVFSAAISAVGQGARLADMANTPDRVHGYSSGNLAGFADQLGIFYRYEYMQKEYIQIIDQYFSRYGYQVNEVKKPNLNSRPNWNYIQTENCLLSCGAPQEDVVELQNIFNSGVTIWHNAGTFGNYNNDNK